MGEPRWGHIRRRTGLYGPGSDRIWAVLADLGRLILKLFVSDRRRSHLWRYVGALRFGVRRLETLGPAN